MAKLPHERLHGVIEHTKRVHAVTAREVGGLTLLLPQETEVGIRGHFSPTERLQAGMDSGDFTLRFLERQIAPVHDAFGDIRTAYEVMQEIAGEVYRFDWWSHFIVNLTNRAANTIDPVDLVRPPVEVISVTRNEIEIPVASIFNFYGEKLSEEDLEQMRANLAAILAGVDIENGFHADIALAKSEVTYVGKYGELILLDKDLLCDPDTRLNDEASTCLDILRQYAFKSSLLTGRHADHDLTLQSVPYDGPWGMPVLERIEVV